MTSAGEVALYSRKGTLNLRDLEVFQAAVRLIVWAVTPTLHSSRIFFPYGTYIASIRPDACFSNIPISTPSLSQVFCAFSVAASGQVKSAGNRKTLVRGHAAASSSGFSRPKNCLAYLRK